MDVLDSSLLWSFTTTAAVPPVPAPEVMAVAGGVLVLPGIDRRRYFRWHRDVLDFWIDYFRQILNLSPTEARLRAAAMMNEAEAGDQRSAKDYWRGYFKTVEQKRLERLLEQDEEDLLLM